MKLPGEILFFLSNEEISTLLKLYGTDLYTPYLRKLKVKYKELWQFLDNDGDDSA